MKKGRIAALALCAVMLLASCSNQTSMEQVTERGEGTKITKEPLNVTIHLHTNGNIVFKDDWEVFEEAFKKTNIKLRGTASAASADSNEAFNIMMASGNLPDIIHGNRLDSINKYGMEGAFIPLNDLIEKYAPNIKAFFDEKPSAKKSVTAADGNIYIIPFVFEGHAAKAWFIRKDWLDKFNLPIPTTVEEFHNALLTFKNGDPNENGKSDEIPFFTRDRSVNDLLPLFGARSSFYVDDIGKVRMGAYDETFKFGMQQINKWYREGLIDPEVFTRGSNARDVLLSDNRGGATHDWITSTGSYNEKLSTVVKGFNLEGIVPPADVNGRVWEASVRNELSGKGWGISTSSKYPEQMIRYMDFWFTEEGRRLGIFGIEGKHYDMVGGEPQFKTELLNADEPLLQMLNRIGAQVEYGIRQDLRYETQAMSEKTREVFNTYTNGGFLAPEFPTLAFTLDERKIIDEKLTAIDTYIGEMRQKWTFGERGETADVNFNEYQSRLRSMGIEDVLRQYQAAYDRYIKN